MVGLILDLRHSARSLARNPGFTIVAIAVLALGIGVNAAIFSVVSAVLIRPLPYLEPDRLVELFLPVPGGDLRGPVSAIDFEDWREQNHVFKDLALVNTFSRGLTLTGRGEPEQLETAYVHPALFATLGIQPAVGRALVVDDNGLGRNRVVVLSHGLWSRRFGADPAIAGRMVTLDGQPFTIAGVMPPAYRFPEATTDVWAPESLIDAARAPRRRDTRYQRVIARLDRGVTIEQAHVEMNTIAARLMTQHPDTNAGRSIVTIVPLRPAIVGESTRAAMLILLGAAAFVLLIACANVGNLLLERTVARRHEVGVRLALGAGRLRIVRQVMSESLLLAFAGGALGLLAATWSLDALLILASDSLPTQNVVAVDGWVLGFALAACIVSAVVCGIVPAIRISRADPQRLVRAGSRGSTAGLEQRRFRGALVVAEVALAFVLVVGAILMLTSFGQLLRVDPGFDPKGLLTVSMNASSSRYPERQGYLAFYRELLDRVEQVPGVQVVGSTRNLPLRDTPETWPVGIDGQPPVPAGREPLIAVHQVSPGYFRAMAIPLLEGRVFAAGDRNPDAGVGIVSRAMARRFWPSGTPVGQVVHYGPRTVRIVGVVGDVRQMRLESGGQAAIYVPQEEDPRRGFTLVIRTFGDPGALAPIVRREILAVDPEHPILRMATMEQVRGEAMARPRLMTFLLGIFGGLALVLAFLGVYGVVAYAVSMRTHEFGVRMALGARPRDVFSIVLREGASLALAGILAGTIAALIVTRFLSSQLFEIGTIDGSVFVAVGGLLLGASVMASLLPALRATRSDPLAALHCE
jgi:putative ABC transport system permease protein